MSNVRTPAIVACCLWAAMSNGPMLGAQSRAAARGPALSLRVTRQADGVRVSLDAERASLRDVGDSLARQLRIPVIVGASLAGEVVSANFSDLALEAALPLLAPRVIIDQELRQDSPAAPQALYLLTFSDPEPASVVNQRAGAQGLFLEGNTEDTGASRDSDPLQVSYARGLLTVNAQQQRLADVVTVIADVLGVPLNAQGAGEGIVDVILPPMSPADLLPRLSPAVRTLVRFDLNSAERSVLRITLAPAGSNRAR